MRTYWQVQHRLIMFSFVHYSVALIPSLLLYHNCVILIVIFISMNNQGKIFCKHFLFTAAALHETEWRVLFLFKIHFTRNVEDWGCRGKELKNFPVSRKESKPGTGLPWWDNSPLSSHRNVQTCDTTLSSLNSLSKLSLLRLLSTPFCKHSILFYLLKIQPGLSTWRQFSRFCLTICCRFSSLSNL